MNDRESDKLKLIAAHGAAIRKLALAESIQAVFADHAAKGRLQSGATIKVAIRLMHQTVDDLLQDVTAAATRC